MDRGMSLNDWAKAFYRRRWLLGTLAGSIAFCATTWVMLAPSRYSATSVIRLEQPRIGEEMVQRTVSDLIEQRLLTIRQELLARPVLQRAIQDLNLYPDTVAQKGLDAAVESMRQAVTVKVEGEAAFEMTFEHENPLLASQVANRLPELYAEENLALRRGQAQRATRLFQNELKVLGQQLDAQEKAITEFKLQRMGELPEQLETNMRALERVSGLIASKGDQLRASETRRSELSRSRYAADSEVGRLKAAEDGLTRTLLAAQTTWTDEHPEVTRLKKEWGSVEARRKELELEMQVEQRERERAAAVVVELKAQLTELEKSAAIYQARLDNTPRWAQELNVLQRDYDVLKGKYQSMVSRKVEAELSEQLEAQSAPSLFRVVSEAAIPTLASKPDRFGGTLLSFLGAIAAAMLVGGILELRDESLKESKQLVKSTALPVLAAVPELPVVAKKHLFTRRTS